MLKIASLLALTLLVGCSLAGTSPAPDTATSAPGTPLTEQPMSNATVDGWVQVSNGLERRELLPDGNRFARFIAVRVDPTQYTFRVHYSAGNPLSLDQWRERLPDATAIINANFFTPAFEALGMVIADGQIFGSSYTDRGGTFGILDGQPVIRSNIYEPYRNEPYTQAIQAFPMLVYNGEVAYTRTTDNRPTRRSVIGIDSAGRVVLLAAPFLGPGLYDLSAYLADNELDLIDAFNLDGGGSTMLYVDDGETAIQSLDPVPVVLAIYPN